MVYFRLIVFKNSFWWPCQRFFAAKTLISNGSHSHKTHTDGFLWANHKEVNKPTSSHERIITLLFNYNYAKSVKRWFKQDFANEQQISCAIDYHHRLGNLICKLLKTSAGQITAQGAVVCAALWPRHAAPNPHTKKKNKQTLTANQSGRLCKKDSWQQSSRSPEIQKSVIQPRWNDALIPRRGSLLAPSTPQQSCPTFLHTLCCKSAATLQSSWARAPRVYTFGRN